MPSGHIDGARGGLGSQHSRIGILSSSSSSYFRSNPSHVKTKTKKKTSLFISLTDVLTHRLNII